MTFALPCIMLLMPLSKLKDWLEERTTQHFLWWIAWWIVFIIGLPLDFIISIFEE